jgi:hypothetical protein
MPLHPGHKLALSRKITKVRGARKKEPLEKGFAPE